MERTLQPDSPRIVRGKHTLMGHFPERIAESARDLMQEGLGAVFFLRTTVFSNAILAQGTNLNITSPSERGDLLVEDIIIRGHTGGGLVSLTAGDTLRIISTNNYGSSIVMAVRVADVGTQMHVNMESARALILREKGLENNERPGAPYVLEQGKRLQMYNIAGNGTGDGKVDVLVKFRRLSNDANVNV